jgi:hypothetical protein
MVSFVVKIDQSQGITIGSLLGLAASVLGSPVGIHRPKMAVRTVSDPS